MPIRISTRESPLALWQAEHVKALIERTHHGVAVSLVPMTTIGDQLLDRSLATVGGKGLFVKELEAAMLEGRADIAVHSMKDVATEEPEGLVIDCALPREDPRDAFVALTEHAGLLDLPAGAVVGTSSLRRRTSRTSADALVGGRSVRSRAGGSTP